MGLDADSDLALSLVSDNTQRLTSAVNSLPQLMEKKRLIDMHTTIATGEEYCMICSERQHLAPHQRRKLAAATNGEETALRHAHHYRYQYDMQ